MEIKKFNLQQINGYLEFLIKEARSTSNGTGDGEKSKPTAKEDGLTLATINGISIHYTFEYENNFIYIFKKGLGTKNKSYRYTARDEDYILWTSLLYSIRESKKQSVPNPNDFLIGDNNEANKGIGRDTSEVTLDKTEEQKEEYPRSDRVIDGESKVNTMPPKPNIF